MIVRVAEHLEGPLRGQLLGKKHFAHVCGLLAPVPLGELVLLDFGGVELVTGSWINAVIVPLFRWAAEEQNDLFPVLSNAEETWLDDLALVAGWTHQCYLVAKGTRYPPKCATLVGLLEPSQRSTLEAVVESGSVTGAQLERQRRRDRTKATAWNNRLKDLHAKRLLRRHKMGREQVYSPVVTEIKFHG